ncbi:hypothetical protein BEK98_44180 [Streptomyces diastatochromogenes]|uniref:Uncharacterized protein n=1 Tax=Streptomyces diastatochromogenes TaxID=42236 RepID=A0A233RUV9_STRDA|nr:hypothetical protein BEK98_44180 [Streptomyces diastatochromogenes]
MWDMAASMTADAKLVEADRQIPDGCACRVVHGVGDRGCCADDADFTDAVAPIGLVCGSSVWSQYVSGEPMSALAEERYAGA